MLVKAKFPMNATNRKAIREQLLLDSTGSGVEKALFEAAEAAAGSGQKVFVSRSYGAAGRLSVWIVDSRDTEMSRDSQGRRQKSSTGTRKERIAALREALGRVNLN